MQTFIVDEDDHYTLYILNAFFVFTCLKRPLVVVFSGAVPPKLQKHKRNVQHGEPFVRFAMEYV